MTRKTRLFRIVFLTMAATLTVGSSAPQDYDWSERGVFVLGSLVLDFKDSSGGTEVFSGASRWGLQNCSTKDYYCSDGRLADLVLPKECADPLEIGTTWTINNISTVVLNVSRTSPIKPVPGRPTFLLATKGIPNLIWVYRPDGGIEGFYYKPRGGSDIVDVAKISGLEGLQSGVANRDYVFYPLSTFDSFGPCTYKQKR